MNKRTERRHLKELQPFADLYAQIVGKVIGATDRQLTYWRKCVRTPTETNCGWTTYQVSELVQNLIIQEQRRRNYTKANREKSKAK